MARIIFTIVALGPLVCLTGGCDKARRARHLSRGDKYFTAGDYPKAEVEYLIVLQRDMTNTHAIGRLGAIYFDEGRFARAYPRLAVACKLAPDDLDLQYKLGSLYASMGRTAEARRQANLILDKMPGHAGAPVLLAESVTSTNELEEVHQRLTKLSAQIGETAPLHLAFGTLHLRQGDFKAAEIDFKRAMALDPKSSDAYHAWGTLCWAQTNLPDAAAALKTAMELAPAQSARALSYADFKLRTEKNPEGGKQVLREVSNKYPGYMPAWIRQADVALAETNYAECNALLKQALTRDPTDYDALLRKGRLAVAQGDAGKAVVELERMSSVYPGAPQVHYQLALAHVLNSDTAKALACLDRAITLNSNFDEAILVQAGLNIKRNDTAAAITALTALVKRQPRLPAARLELAAAYEAKRDLEAALATYRQLEELYPKNSETPLRMGLIYLQQNRNDKARKAFEKTLELAPDSAPAVERLVDLDLLDGQYSNALERVQKAIEKYPKSPLPLLLEAKVRMAQAASRVNEELKKENQKSLSAQEVNLFIARLPLAQKDMDDAEAALLKAIELNPNLPEPYLLLARLYLNSQRTPKALDQLNRDLAKNPKDVAALTLLASIQEQGKDFPAARATYERLLTIYPESVFALNNLAYLYLEHFGMLDQAYELARKAREIVASEGQPAPGLVGSATATRALRSDQAYTAGTLGWILFKRGEYDRALSLLQESAEKMKLDKLPAEAGEHFHLGMTYYMLGQEEQAQRALKHALDLNADFPGKSEAERRLAILALDAGSAGPELQAGLEKELAELPGDPVVTARLASIYEKQKAPDKAAKVCEAVLKVNSNNVPVMVRLVRLYSGALRNPQKALALAKEAYKLAPGDPEILCTLGRLVFEAGDCKRAVSLLQQGAEKKAQSPDVLYDLALAYYSVGRISDATATMRRALEAGSSFSRADEAKRFLDLAPLALDPAGALAAAAKAQETLKTYPDDVPALMIAALCARQRGDVQAARLSYERVLGHYAEFAPAKKPLALLYLDLGNNEKAYEMAMQARQALPDDVDVARTLGIASYYHGDYGNSVRLLNETIRKGGEDAKTWYYLGMAHFRLKAYKESQQALQRAVDLNLESKLLEDAKRVLPMLK